MAPARWPGDPLPTEAYETASGFALALSITSLTDLAGKSGLATKIYVNDATNETGKKSFSVSKASFG